MKRIPIFAGALHAALLLGLMAGFQMLAGMVDRVPGLPGFLLALCLIAVAVPLFMGLLSEIAMRGGVPVALIGLMAGLCFMGLLRDASGMGYGLALGVGLCGAVVLLAALKAEDERGDVLFDDRLRRVAVLGGAIAFALGVMVPLLPSSVANTSEALVLAGALMLTLIAVVGAVVLGAWLIGSVILWCLTLMLVVMNAFGDSLSDSWDEPEAMGFGDTMVDAEVEVPAGGVNHA